MIHAICKALKTRNISFIWGSFVKTTRSFSSANMPAKPPGQKVNVDGIDIHYERAGNGPQVLLMLPGVLGSTQTDFAPQLKGLNRQLFTLVAWDPPGYGFSRPPDRSFSKDFFHKDARLAARLMQVLQFEKYSVFGWSDGGITALILAAKNPAVERLIVLGANAYITDNDAALYTAIADIDKWSPRMREPMIRLYGEKYFREKWSEWVKGFDEIHKADGNICKEVLSDITCPTLIAHGAKDAMVASEHPTYLQKHIKGSVLKVFPEGKHNVHIRYADEFNKLIEEFICSR